MKKYFLFISAFLIISSGLCNSATALAPESRLRAGALRERSSPAKALFAVFSVLYAANILDPEAARAELTLEGDDSASSLAFDEQFLQEKRNRLLADIGYAVELSRKLDRTTPSTDTLLFQGLHEAIIRGQIDVVFKYEPSSNYSYAVQFPFGRNAVLYVNEATTARLGSMLKALNLRHEAQHGLQSHMRRAENNLEALIAALSESDNPETAIILNTAILAHAHLKIWMEAESAHSELYFLARLIRSDKSIETRLRKEIQEYNPRDQTAFENKFFRAMEFHSADFSKPNTVTVNNVLYYYAGLRPNLWMNILGQNIRKDIPVRSLPSVSEFSDSPAEGGIPTVDDLLLKILKDPSRLTTAKLVLFSDPSHSPLGFLYSSPFDESGRLKYGPVLRSLGRYVKTREFMGIPDSLLLNPIERRFYFGFNMAA